MNEKGEGQGTWLGLTTYEHQISLSLSFFSRYLPFTTTNHLRSTSWTR